MKKSMFFLTLLLLFPSLGQAEVKSQVITYKHGDQTFKGYLAFDDSNKEKRPGILIVHEWWGLDDYARMRADQLAKAGFVAFAADMFGDGKTTEHPKEAAAMAGMVRKNQEEWIGRAKAGLSVLQNHPSVDPAKLGSIGYCFGGSTSLKLAHSGAPVAAVVSFHGALLVPTDEELKNIKAKILICHGALDKFIPEDTIQKVRAAYEAGKVDYALIYLGNAVHSFTVPDADKKNLEGIAYNAAADRRSWAAMMQLFKETFGEK